MALCGGGGTLGGDLGGGSPAQGNLPAFFTPPSRKMGRSLQVRAFSFGTFSVWDVQQHF